MRNYALMLFAQGDKREERLEFRANDPVTAFGWAERNAPGRKLEIFEDGRSLGVARLDSGGNLWILGPPSGRGFDKPRTRPRAIGIQLDV